MFPAHMFSRQLLLTLVVLLAALGLGTAGARADPLPANLAGALQSFRADGPKGWMYTQTTASGAESMEESFDPARPESDRWVLLARDGRAPTPEELKVYREGKSRRAGGATAPRVQDQIDPASATKVRAEGDLVWWRFGMQPGGTDDSSAAHLDVTFCFHVPTLTVTSVEIASREPYSPVIGIKIAESRTVMTYSLPENGRPSLLQQVTLRVRGRAFWVKSLDQNMTITYAGHRPAGRN
jgi:hypothetical protein